MARKRDQPDAERIAAEEAPPEPPAEAPPAPESFHVDPQMMEQPEVTAFADTPVSDPEPGRSLPDAQIPYPDWMTALDEPDAAYDVAFRLRGRHDEQAIHRGVATLDTATQLVRQYQRLGWGGDVTVSLLADASLVAREPAPLVDQNAPI